MARSTKRSADAPPKSTAGSLTRIARGSPTAPTRASAVRVARQSAGPAALGSPIYEELVAELGDPTS